MPSAPPPASTGVYVGMSSMDYNKLVLRYSQAVTAFTSTGASLSVASGRLSYTFGLRGPAVTVDTACSSALVGLHMAVGALRGGQCGAALAAGVNLMLSPDVPAAFQKAGVRVCNVVTRCHELVVSYSYFPCYVLTVIVIFVICVHLAV